MNTTETRPDSASAVPASTTMELPVVVDARGIAVLRLGTPDEPVVTFTKERLLALDRALIALAGRSGLRGVVITGPGPGMFCAGADIGLIHSIQSVAEGRDAATLGRSIFERCAKLPVPVVAVLGSCGELKCG